MIAFDGHQEVTALLVEDLLGGFDIRMQGIDQDGLARQVQLSEHLPRSGDLIALTLSDDAAEEASRAADRVDHFHAAVPHLLAINDDQRVLDGARESPLPIQ